MWLYYFYFEMSYNSLKSKNPGFLLNKNINFNENENKSKMENPTHSFREMNLLLQLLSEFFKNAIWLAHDQRWVTIEGQPH